MNPVTKNSKKTVKSQKAGLQRCCRCRAARPAVVLPHPADERQRLALLLVAEQRDALHQVGSQDEILDAHHLVDVELSVDEGHARQVVVLQDPQEDLRPRGGSYTAILMAAHSHTNIKTSHVMSQKVRRQQSRRQVCRCGSTQSPDSYVLTGPVHSGNKL